MPHPSAFNVLRISSPASSWQFYDSSPEGPFLEPEPIHTQGGPEVLGN